LFNRPFNILRALVLVILGGLSTSCMLLDEAGLRSNASENGTGVVRFELDLEQTQDALRKAASADTAFSLDSLIIILTAPGAVTQTHRIAVTGRADLGNVVVPPQTYTLQGLRPWKARFISIDTSISPLRRDTVHLDSLSFSVVLNDTVPLAKTVSPVYSILRVRFLSTNQDSIPSNVLFVRLRVNGVMRDSSVIGGSNASLNWLQAMTGNTVFAAGDSGKILRSSDNGATWGEYKVSGSPNLSSGYFLNNSTGWVLSRNNGTIYYTTDGAVSWQQRYTIGSNVNGVYFTGSDDGFAIGDGGGIYKVGNAGNFSHTLVSNTAHNLNSVFFTSANVGYVVGENETILKTTNGTAPAGTLPQNGGIVWSPVAGGWFFQTSNAGSTNLNAIHFQTSQLGWSFGNAGTVRKTTDGGATWAHRNNSVDGDDINAVWFTPGGAGFVVGNGGAFRKMDSEWWWAKLHSSYSLPNVDLLDVHLNGSDTGLIVGKSGSIFRTLNASMTISDGGANRIIVSTIASGTTRNLRSVRFVAPGSKIAVAVGDTGLIRRSTDAGATWTTRTSGTTRNLYEVRFANASVGWAVGDYGTILKTTDGGLTWTSKSAGAGITADLRTLGVVSPDTVYASGVGGVVRKTTNGGSTAFYGQESPTTQTLNRLFFFNSAFGFAVGNNGVILNAVNQGDNWTGGGIKRSLKGVYFIDANTGWIVGADGVILKTTNGGTVWTQQPSGVTTTLYGVYFRSATLGWVTGEGGKILKTTDGGATWSPQISGTTITLRWASFRNNNAGFVIGGTQSMLSTSNGGDGANGWAGSFVGIPGAKTFDQLLTYKYLKPNQSHTILFQAIDQASPLRGYQGSRTVIIGAGKDSTIVQPITKCGYGSPTPACTL
jgi:photosystem II stability/assembly factor-like uncharacterized protein